MKHSNDIFFEKMDNLIVKAELIKVNKAFYTLHKKRLWIAYLNNVNELQINNLK